jgi:hypothetical protein
VTGECGAAVAVPKGREGWPRLVFCRGLVEKLCAGPTSLEWLAPQCSTARRQGHAIFRLSFTGKAANQRRNPFLDVCHVRQPLHCRALVLCREMCVLPRNRSAFVPYVWHFLALHYVRRPVVHPPVWIPFTVEALMVFVSIFASCCLWLLRAVIRGR